MDATQIINIQKEAEKLIDYFSPKIISEVNNEYVKIAKIKGEDIPWHNHENEDELFYIINGNLLMEIENQPSFTMKTGDLYVVPKGVNHRVSSSDECLIMLIETKSTKHTGDVITPITKSIDNQKY
ncbi:mannose-6-phosphate isomerase-like protein (cupin superfamily) [Tenacibaculum lutimaris]|uniref:Mannose-6-phosphate isomerase-like protein (Cupin superfamily) n=1 Tax=Tenacibaculum lutimaris TaxID=285258 RepID=A0A420DZ73_9FLAO|nr:cupin domain-containing protein [Tenacibaculum lutimaris]RKF03118.1 mannose-6-phosphate isomerase-like protein (cupin superfamily) [Tenacibaculum lutimaris]